MLRNTYYIDVWISIENEGRHLNLPWHDPYSIPLFKFIMKMELEIHSTNAEKYVLYWTWNINGKWRSQRPKGSSCIAMIHSILLLLLSIWNGNASEKLRNVSGHSTHGTS